MCNARRCPRQKTSPRGHAFADVTPGACFDSIHNVAPSEHLIARPRFVRARLDQKPVGASHISPVFTPGDLTKPVAKLHQGIWREARIAEVDKEGIPIGR